jgi:hypothetical protein
MVVNQINVTGAAFLEAEDHAPVRPDSHAPKTFQVALERVEPKAREIHVVGLSGTVEDGENVFDLLDVIRVYALGFAVLKKPFEPLVPEAPNHRNSL